MYMDLGFVVGLVAFLAVVGVVIWATMALTRKR
jgi:hypothetical protein